MAAHSGGDAAARPVGAAAAGGGEGWVFPRNPPRFRRRQTLTRPLLNAPPMDRRLLECGIEDIGARRANALAGGETADYKTKAGG
jgi:hypothetical protein